MRIFKLMFLDIGKVVDTLVYEDSLSTGLARI